MNINAVWNYFEFDLTYDFLSIKVMSILYKLTLGGNAMTVEMEIIFIIVFVLVDDWYQQEGVALLKGKRGAKPAFSDSEVITLLIMMDFIPYPSERQFLGFIRANSWTCSPTSLIVRSSIGVRGVYGC